MSGEAFEEWLNDLRTSYGELSFVLEGDEKSRAAAINNILTEVLIKYRTVLPPPTTLS